MQLTIHRGSREIGGTCLEIAVGGRSILLDAGSPLGESSSTVDLTQLDFGDVFISHPHRDHFGLIEGLDPGKTVHIGPTARQLLAATRVFLGEPPLTNRFSELHHRRPVELGPELRVTPYLMDHSCVDAFGLLVEAGGKRLYYSGDFRAHGPRRQAFAAFLANPPRDVDALLMEGTMLGRDNAAFPDEAAVADGMLQALREFDRRAAFLVCSGQHIDRLCAACRASQQAGRTFVTDIYTAFILHTVASRFASVPALNQIRVLTKGLTARAHYKKVAENREYFGAFARELFRPQTAITMDEIAADPGRYLLKVGNFSDLLGRLAPCGVIYSMWSGYLEEPKHRLVKEHPQVDFREIHTSGHAVREDLRRMVDALRPRHLIPVHTEYPEAYADFGAVLPVPDGERWQL